MYFIKREKKPLKKWVLVPEVLKIISVIEYTTSITF